MGKSTSSNRKMSAKSHSRQGQQAPLTLESFAQRKGQIRALEEFHKRKDRKRVETAKALRSYRKAMKQEGFDAGKGASRKRVPSSEKAMSAVDETDDGSNASRSDQVENPANGGKKRKMNPFQKSLQKAEQKKMNTEQKKIEKESREETRKQKLKQRKIQSKLLAKRSRKGQPIMKNIADNLLVKLKKQNQSR